MPKIYLTDAQREAAQAKSGDESLQIAIATRMVRDGLSQAEIGRRIGMTKQTFGRRLKRPEEFTLVELRRLASVLRFTPTELQKCL